jgi:PAS domain S-box-containing protein
VTGAEPAGAFGCDAQAGACLTDPFLSDGYVSELRSFRSEATVRSAATFASDARDGDLAAVRRRRAVEGLQTLALGAIVFAFVWLSAAFMRSSSGPASVWPASAIVVSCLLKSDLRRWPAMVAAAYAGQMCAYLVVGHLPIPGWISFCNIIEIVSCAGGLRRFAGRRLDLSQTRHLLFFVGFASLGPALYLLGLYVSLFFVHTKLSPNAMLTMVGASYMAHALGLLIVAPALLSLKLQSVRGLFSRSAWVCNGLLLAGLALGVIGVSRSSHWPLYLLETPLLLMVAFRMELTGAALGGLLTAAISLGMFVAGSGPTSRASADFVGQAIIHQFNLLLTIVSALMMGAVLTQRRQLKNSLVASLAASERARAEAEDANRRARMAEEISGVGYWRMDVASRIVTWSGRAYRLDGLDGADPFGQTPVLAAIHPDDLPKLEADLKASIALGRDFECQFRHRLRDGGWRHIVARGVCERDDDGAVATLTGVALDVTHLKLADEALRASETRYRLLADHSTDIIALFEPGGRILYVSPAVRALGWEPEQLVGRNVLEFAHPDDIQQALERRDHAINGGGGVDPISGYEFRFLTGDGQHQWLEGRPTLIRDADGAPLQTVVTYRNVTARRQLEQDLYEAKIQAEAAAEAKAEFLANMSHEIRTPLTGIIGFSGLLEEARDLPDAARLYVQRIATSSRSLLSVVNDILDFSKLDARQVELDPHPFDPAAFFVDTVDLLAAQAANKGLSLGLDVDPSVPDLIEADSSRLRQVVLNLVNNALKFTVAGGVSVSAAYDAPERLLRVAVSDTGRGIAAERRDRLFQRFSQVDSSISRSHGGTGLGLAICKGLVDLMGGTIGVESVEGEGATFWFTIAAAPATERAEPEAEVAVDRDDRPARILLVDDVSVNRELVKAMLQPLGHTFVEAEGGAEAVQAALGSTFDMIFMDLQMPGMDGLTATRIIRETADLNGDTPIIALSANVLSEHLAACAEAGMDDHLSKPIQPAELLTKIGRWRGGRQSNVFDDEEGMAL